MTDLRGALASPETKARYVRRLFDTIADRYDLITVLLSFGRDRSWKKRLVNLANVRQGSRALDLACGTGDIAFALADCGAQVTGLDITLRMLRIARSKGRVPFVAGDMTSLPFPDAAFDIVTAGYGIRNVPRIQPAINEIHRVLRPGGTFVSLDFDRPSNAIVRAVYLGYLNVVGSALGWLLHGNADTYRYIPASISRYPGAAAVSSLLEHSGFEGCRVVALLGGLMAINVARSRPRAD
ncbi:MAG TPA: ubiquinone/menaquinone biosynthesis methyltransferase [Vicinamibacterales bacterium]|nr:ubiquinone/menaquinone biosynthesis methyltransferase [Vicinamibacterales bacterium]